MNRRPMDSFDLRQAIIPFSLLEITNHFKRMESGDVMEIIGSDADITTIVNRILPLSQCEILRNERYGTDGLNILVRLRKKAR
jgi:TusA-related sulfurtransferase